MNKKEIQEAANWIMKYSELQNNIKRHLSTCKHWSLGETYHTQHHDPQFPDDEFADCEFCGKTFKNAEIHGVVFK